MRTAVYSMADLQSQIDVANKRLATGKKVNNAIDNATSYFAAKAFSTEATKLNGLIESMSQARQTIDKANKAIDGGVKLLESANALARQASQSTVDSDRANYQAQVADLLNQVARLFSDSGFNGKNLLINDTQTGANYSKPVGTASGELGNVGGATAASASELAVYNGGVLDVQTNTAATDFTAINLRPIDVRLGAAVSTTTAGPPPVTTVIGGLGVAISTAGNETGFTATVGSMSPIAAGSTTGANNWNMANQAVVERFRTATQAAINTLQGKSAAIATQASVIDVRMAFTKDTARINNDAADNLLVADINEEGANLSSLQTKQQLAVQALSLSNRADQAILRLF
jgi:flagellin-like hook-associated protein FlgL